VIQASAAFNAGASGQGILVADIDTGADPTQPDLVGAISPLSTDIIAGRNQPVGTDQHANEVDTVLAARFNNFGTLGVAYDSTILSIRADTGPMNTFNDSDLANGIEYAIANHARIINLSLGAPTPSSFAFQQAMQQAVAAGIVFTI
jgi:subtilisin family serine protease